MERFFSKDVPDLRSRESILDWLDRHTTYYTMNPWNKTRDYAHCVKVHSLDLPEDVKDKAHQFIMMDERSDDFQWIIDDRNFDLKQETGCKAFFNGASGGWLVFDYGMTDHAEVETWSMKFIREYARDVMAFDRFADRLREDFIDYLRSHDFVEEEYIETKKHIVEKYIAG